MAKRRAGLVVLSVLLVWAVSATGCSKKGDKASGAKKSARGSESQCEKVCKMIKKCPGEMAEAMMSHMGLKPADLPEGTVEKVRKDLASKFGDVEKCVKECEGEPKKGEEEMAKAIKACGKESDCKTFSKCFVEAVMEDKKK